MAELQTDLFEVQTIESAPESVRSDLEAAKKKNGMVPNMYGVMANSPAALHAYLGAYNAFRNETSFNAAEQELILLTISFHNDCHYCMAAHSTIADMNGVPAEITEALRYGKKVPDEKLEALHHFTRTLLEKRGWPADVDVEAFLSAGYTRQNILDILAALAAKMISNYSNHLANTPVDKPFQKRAWNKEDYK